MKKPKITSIASVICMTLFMIYFTSCTKEDTAPANADVENATDRNGNSYIFPPNASMFGQSYAQWSARWWKWSMEHSLAGHPFIDDPSFDVSSGQSGKVWYLAAPFGTVVRNITVPHGKALFVGLLNAEASDLEGLGTTYADQLANADFSADHIRNLTLSIDGSSISNIGSYRVASPQFNFTAPTPWIFGATGGAGTAVGDGYYVMVKPLAKGSHTIHYSGDFHFAISQGDPFDFDAPIDMTYHITVN